MPRWTCPHCDREFGRTRQSHVCVPGGTVEDTFAPWPARYLDIYRALESHLTSLGPLHADAVKVGVFLKTDRTIAEVRPRARALSLDLVLLRTVDHPRISRHLRTGDRTIHIIKLTSLDDVDNELLEWLTEAYLTATD
ncbi:DUF5655 domain-containing protein [Fodinicola feengrottensis]|uniref:DUF5655 domain-containing protein n=1 Tax=Fodinicola feengrottensis TaxID=435914 RepID=A0ABN2J5N0_9ACTN|nr:DUF5655 domain-containing protein [Fodinicola feengrottensis]